MTKVMEAVKSAFTPKLPKPEEPVPLPTQDSVATLQAGQRKRAELAAKSGEVSTKLTEQKLGDQGSPLIRTGALAGSSVITA